MKTISQIGKAALLRIFKPESKIDAITEFYRTVDFPKEEFDLQGPVKVNNSNGHYGSLQFFSGVNYMVWGIELGLVGLTIKDDMSIFNSITELITPFKEFTPSHLIVKSWSHGDIGGEHEDYSIYRLSQKQEIALRNTIK